MVGRKYREDVIVSVKYLRTVTVAVVDSYSCPDLSQSASVTGEGVTLQEDQTSPASLKEMDWTDDRRCPGVEASLVWYYRPTGRVDKQTCHVYAQSLRDVYWL